MELHIKIIGSMLVFLGVMHIAFPRYFQWKQELNSISLINRQMMYVHTFFIALVVFLTGVICLTSPEELANTRLGGKLTLGLFIFWIIRLFIQFFGYSSQLWKGKKLETGIHIVFSILWTYISFVFFFTYWTNSNT